MCFWRRFCSSIVVFLLCLIHAEPAFAIPLNPELIRRDAIVEAVAATKNSVVAIQITQRNTDPFGWMSGQSELSSEGSGVIIQQKQELSICSICTYVITSGKTYIAFILNQSNFWIRFANVVDTTVR